MGIETSVSSSPSLGAITTIIQPFLEAISRVIQKLYTLFLDVLEVCLPALLSAARESLPQLQEMATAGMTPDASSAVFTGYLGTITFSKSSPSGNSTRLAESILRTNAYRERQAYRS
jgi:hypothetical protein